MELEKDDSGVVNISVEPSGSSVNNLILDYYKKFGRKRDLEQFFSLSTAQSEIRDPTGTFWRKMKSQNDSSDSGEKKSESSAELCRISIKCSIPEPASLQQGAFKEQLNSDSESPPIVNEEMDLRTPGNSDEESVKSEGVQSQRSNDAALDTSMNKPHSPTSSITSQRKLEWDSLADVGYANESDRKTSASSLSTLERLALNQQYSHNDTKQHIKLGAPTSHSTPVDETESKSKGKKGLIKKTTKIYQKDVDLVELNVPHNSQTNLPQAINVNLSKHICFNVEKDGEINIDNIKKDITVTPEKNIEIAKQSLEKVDKEIQTTLLVNKRKDINLTNNHSNGSLNIQKNPVLLTMNTLKNRKRKRKLRIAKRKLRSRNKLKMDIENNSKCKATEQVSEAESFEYMPGHIYNQNHLNINQNRGTYIGNKSSLESSAGLTTDSSKGSKHSFSKDLEKTIDILKTVLHQDNNDSTLKKKLIKEVVQRLIKSRYRDDDSSTDFLSGLSFSSKIIGEANHTTTTSTSDTNNTGNKSKISRRKKSILQTTNFNSNAIASTSQSAPNLPTVSNSEKPVSSNLTKPIFFSNTESEMSNKDKNSTDIGMSRKSSEEFYIKYLEALKREQAHKKHLRDKEIFLKQKLVSSETAITEMAQTDLKTQSKLKSLLKDLTRNNYNDGSGDASNLEGHSNFNRFMDPHIFLNNQRSHSVFTLSSGHSDGQNKNPNLKNIIKSALNTSSKAGCSKNEHHYCCCPHHANRHKVAFTDSSVQVNINSNKPLQKVEPDKELRKSIKCTICNKESPRNITKVVSDSETGDLKYICVCSNKGESEKVPENFLVYKCSRLVNKSIQLGDSLNRNYTEQEQSSKEIYTCCDEKNKKPKVILRQEVKEVNMPQHSKSSQTNVNLNLMLQRKSSLKSASSQFSGSTNELNIARSESNSPKFIQEAIRSIQTDISINPKLSDPCLSDINIIADNECVKLVKEQYKEIIKSVSENNTEPSESGKKSQPSSGNSSDKYMSKVSVAMFSTETLETKKCLNDAYIDQLDKGVQSDLDLVDNNQTKNFRDQFTIPIQGTNMTLQVNLGTTESNNNEWNLNSFPIKSQGIVTEKTNVAEQYTSLREDCTKSVQCCNANIFQGIKRDYIEQNISDKHADTNEEPPSDPKTCDVKTCFFSKQKSNTYPKKDQNNARKPLLRTNTDISNLEHLDLPPIDFKKCDKANKQKILNNTQKIITDQPPTTVHQYKPEKCTTCTDNKKNLTVPTTKLNDRNTMDKNQTKKFTGSYDQQKIMDQSTTYDQNQLEMCTCTGYSNLNVIKDKSTISKKQNQPEKCTACSNQKVLVNQLMQPNDQNPFKKCTACSNQIVLQDQTTYPGNQNEPEKCTACSNQTELIGQPTITNKQIQPEKCIACSNHMDVIGQPLKSNNSNQRQKCTACPNQKDLIEQPNDSSNEKQSEKCKGYLKQLNFTAQFTKRTPQNESESSTSSNRKCQPNLASKSHSQNQSKKCLTCSDLNHAPDLPNNCNKKYMSKTCTSCSNKKDLPDPSMYTNTQHPSEMYLTCSSKVSKAEAASKREEIRCGSQSKTSASESDCLNCDVKRDPLLDMIESITNRYSKKDVERNKRRKCFKEIMKVLKYLLDTEENTDHNKKSSNSSSMSDVKQDETPENGCIERECCPSKTYVDKGVQLSLQSKLKKCPKSESSEIAVTSEFPTTSSDSATCKVLNKIKKECEKYHQKRCKSHNAFKPCETSSTTSVNCEQCKRVHHCYCLRYKCKTHKTKICGEKPKKKCVAYNLILQTSDSVASEEVVPGVSRCLKSIIVKVPSKRKQPENIPFKEMAAKLERNIPKCGPRSPCRGHRSRSLPNESEISSTEEFLRNPQTYTVREYLERNRPDFIEKSSRRQDCLKTINETRPERCPPCLKMVVVHTPKCAPVSGLDSCNTCYGGVPFSCNPCVDPYTHMQTEVTRIANERNAKRKLLSMQLAKQQTLNELTDEELRRFAKQLSEELRRKKIAPKFINEREMKKHSEKIYKSLPEVTRKKEELKKANIKKTNLLMANIFKKNLQKKTLRGSVNLSNYSTVIKI